MPSRLKTLMVLALPMVLARASQSVITFADAIQVSDLGDKAIAATASGGLNVMAWSALAMGTVFIVQSFVAQLAGRGQRGGRVNSIAFMPAFGLASSGAILAARTIGQGDRDAVWPQVKLTLACTITWMVAIACSYVFVPERMLGWFAPEGVHATQLIEVGSSMLVISALWQVFDATGITLAEALRAAGDPSWAAKMRIGAAWAMFVPSAYITVQALHGGAVGAMLCLVAYLGVVAIGLALRFRSGAWRKIDLIAPKLV